MSTSGVGKQAAGLLSLYSATDTHTNTRTTVRQCWQVCSSPLGKAPAGQLSWQPPLTSEQHVEASIDWCRHGWEAASVWERERDRGTAFSDPRDMLLRASWRCSYRWLLSYKLCELVIPENNGCIWPGESWEIGSRGQSWDGHVSITLSVHHISIESQSRSDSNRAWHIWSDARLGSRFSVTQPVVHTIYQLQDAAWRKLSYQTFQLKKLNFGANSFCSLAGDCWSLGLLWPSNFSYLMPFRSRS